jgi:hypothetical protein
LEVKKKTNLKFKIIKKKLTIDGVKEITKVEIEEINTEVFGV